MLIRISPVEDAGELRALMGVEYLEAPPELGTLQGAYSKIHVHHNLSLSSSKAENRIPLGIRGAIL